MRAHVPVHERRPVPCHDGKPRLLLFRSERSQCDCRYCVLWELGRSASGLSKSPDGRCIHGSRSRRQPQPQPRVHVYHEHDEVTWPQSKKNAFPTDIDDIAGSFLQTDDATPSTRKPTAMPEARQSVPSSSNPSPTLSEAETQYEQSSAEQARIKTAARLESHSPVEPRRRP